MHSKEIFPVKWSIHLCLPTKVFSVYVVKWVTVEWKVLVVEEAPPKSNSESSECMKHFRECSHNDEGKGEGSRTRGRTWTVIQSQQSPQTISQVPMMAFLSCPEFRCRWAPFSERARPWAMWLSSAKGSSWRGLEAKAISQHLRGKRLSVLKADLTVQHGIHHRLCPRLSSRSLIRQSQPVTSNILHKPMTPKCLSQAERFLLDSRRIHTALFLDISISMVHRHLNHNMSKMKLLISPLKPVPPVLPRGELHHHSSIIRPKNRGFLDILFLIPTSSHRLLIILPPKYISHRSTHLFPWLLNPSCLPI